MAVTSKGIVLMVLWILQTSSSENPMLEFEVQEESPRGTFVGDLSEYMLTMYDKDVVDQLQFGFLAQPTQDSNLFTLENSPAQLRTSRPIDREELCPTMEECFLDIDVAIIRPLNYIRVFSVRIWIRDINDNVPTFPEETYPVSMSESSDVGTSITLPVAMDLDSPENGVKGYRLLSRSREFDLKSTPQVGGQIDLHLMLKTPLDRELVDEYSVDVEVYDGGLLSSTVTIVVTVEDANDHSPVFANSTYEVSIAENYPTESGFFVVKATDADSGVNSEITYKFAPRTQNMHGRTFGLEKSMGSLYLKESLDWEKRKEYELDIVATDGGPDARSSQCTVLLKVLDVNDNKPLIIINTFTDFSDARIMENSPQSTFVAHVSVFDSDQGSNGEVVCELSNTEDFYLNNIQRNQYKIETSYVLDRETTAKYFLEINCEDLGQNPLRSSANLTVVVLDENDNSPVFSQPAYSEVLPENNPPDSYIMQLNASDLDEGPNGKVQFEIIGGLTQLVYINRNTGVIRASDQFDFEKTKKLQFTVKVKDGGSPPRSSTARVTITILDLNDRPPIFSQHEYEFKVQENQLKYTPVGKVVAADEDSDMYNRFVFSLLNAGNSGRFAIDPDTGEIKTLVVLDREERDTHYITAVATDLDRPTLTSTTMVVIKVEDVNDNFPVIEYPSRENNTFSISNRVPRGHEILKVTATDADQGLNAKLSYYISSGNYNDAFMINVTTGMLSTKATFEGIKYESYELTLKVNDHGFPAKVATMVLQVTIDELTPYYASPREKEEDATQGNNLMIIIIVAAVSGFIMVILIIAIVAMKVYDRRRPTSVYKCRVEEEKILRKAAILDNVRTASDNQICASPGGTGHRKHPPMDHAHMQQRAMEPRTGSSNASWDGNGGSSMHDSYSLNTTAPDQHLEAHLLALLKQDKGDTESASSAEVSNADSGRGASEEGEQNYHPSSRHAYPSNYGGCQTFSSKSSLPAGPSHGHSSRKTHSKREPDSNTSHNKSHSSSSSAIAKNSNTPQPPTRGSIHCLVREEQERRGRDKSPSGNNSPKKTLTTFASPPSYEACVRENINGSNESVNSGPRSDKKPNGAASCEPRTKSADPLQHIAEEEDCSDFNGDSNQEVDPQELCQEIDNLFFKSVVV